MTISKLLTPVALVATFALAAVPAYAQHGGGGHGGGGHSGGGHSGGGHSSGAAVSRGGGSPGVRSSSVYRGGVAVRGGGVRVVGGRSVFVGGRGVFYRPYYSFRPRLSLGFGFWAGYPVPYPYYDPYYYGYPYPVDPYAYGYAAPSYGYPVQPYASPDPSNYPDDRSSAQSYPAQPAQSVGVEQGSGQSAPGGVSFQITPDTAAVFVDGIYVGTAGTFGPSSQPLGLVTGRHHIEIRAEGYRTMTFDADVKAGQVIPYQGTLQRN
jgi:hypothetical protein